MKKQYNNKTEEETTEHVNLLAKRMKEAREDQGQIAKEPGLSSHRASTPQSESSQKLVFILNDWTLKKVKCSDMSTVFLVVKNRVPPQHPCETKGKCCGQCLWCQGHRGRYRRALVLAGHAVQPIGESEIP